MQKTLDHLSGAITFLLFSLSGFQLPHYIVIFSRILPCSLLLTYLFYSKQTDHRKDHRLQSALVIIPLLVLTALAIARNFLLYSMDRFCLGLRHFIFWIYAGCGNVLIKGLTFLLSLFFSTCIFIESFTIPVGYTCNGFNRKIMSRC